MTKQLPPDPENKNNDRAEWAAAALRHFQCTTGSDYDDALTDLICDLMHWCDRNDFDFDAALSRACVHYEAETAPEVEEFREEVPEGALLDGQEFLQYLFTRAQPKGGAS